MDLALTSDFPATDNAEVVARIRAASSRPRIAWIPPATTAGRERFAHARERFGACGLPDLEYCDIDEQPDPEQLERILGYEVLYLTGGDPVAFQRNLARLGLEQRLRAYLDAGGLVIGASGGAMQLTPNVSLFRLRAHPLPDVVAERAEFTGLGVVEYELLPHLNRLEPSFLDTVRRYSELASCEVIALEDGAAVLHSGAGRTVCGGRAVRFRSGVEAPLAPSPADASRR